jgi:amino acid adenylation domain-containing protein
LIPKEYFSWPDTLSSPNVQVSVDTRKLPDSPSPVTPVTSAPLQVSLSFSPECIHHLFEKQVERTPQAPAISFQQQQLSYADLNERANQLAWYLQEQGIGSGTLVGICMDRSLEIVVAILGVLKAGGAYVPLDPVYPPERLEFILQDAQVKLLLTQQSLQPTLPVHDNPTLYLDTDWHFIAQNRTDNCQSSVTNRDLAYVIYTSGSTGRPKGVLIEHYGLSNMVEAQIDLFNIQASHRLAQFASFSFDASVSEMFMAFLAGAELCIIPSEQRWPPTTLQRFLQEQAITTITLPPSALAFLSPEELPLLKHVISAGEELPQRIASQWSVGRDFFNAYGPTEATVCTSVSRCSQEHERPSIGYPIANMQIYLLNDKLQPAPVGIAAEIYISGMGLARGYLNRPELTTEKFLPHPFSHEPGSRLYKTGDQGRYLPDGSIEYLGRFDRMVKVRGFRIELEEIEVLLDQSSFLLQSLVTVCLDQRNTKRLVAYLIPHPTYLDQEKSEVSQTWLQENISRFLQDHLPRHMLPSAYVILESFPLTVNGKIDRRLLPIPASFRQL